MRLVMNSYRLATILTKLIYKDGVLYIYYYIIVMYINIK